VRSFSSSWSRRPQGASGSVSKTGSLNFDFRHFEAFRKPSPRSPSPSREPHVGAPSPSRSSISRGETQGGEGNKELIGSERSKVVLVRSDEPLRLVYILLSPASTGNLDPDTARLRRRPRMSMKWKSWQRASTMSLEQHTKLVALFSAWHEPSNLHSIC
jgi:hypothetical protein